MTKEFYKSMAGRLPMCRLCQGDHFEGGRCETPLSSQQVLREDPTNLYNNINQHQHTVFTEGCFMPSGLGSEVLMKVDCTVVTGGASHLVNANIIRTDGFQTRSFFPLLLHNCWRLHVLLARTTLCGVPSTKRS